MIQSGPRVNFGRTPKDNDFGYGMPKRCKPWRESSRQQSADLFSVEKVSAGKVIIHCTKNLPGVRGKVITDYEVLGNGDIQVKNHFIPQAPAKRKRNYIQDINHEKALVFQGKEPLRVEVPELSPDQLESFSLQIKFTPTAFTRKNALWTNDDWAPGKMHLEFQNGTLCFFLYGSDDIYFKHPFEPNQEYTLLLVYDSQAKYLKLFVNDELAESKTLASAVPLNLTGKSSIGGFVHENRMFRGCISPFKLWNQALAKGALPASTNELLISYTFDRMQDDRIVDSAGHFPAQLIEVENRLPELPRFGSSLQLPREFNQVSWFGRGPQENYCDRNTSAFMGRYTFNVGDQECPYIRPQEFGYRTDCRWIALQNKKGEGLLFMGDSLLSFSALPYPMLQLDQEDKDTNRHSIDLKKENHVYVQMDDKQMGVGGDNSWGAWPHPQYLLPYGEYIYTYIIRPISGQKDLNALSKKRL